MAERRAYRGGNTRRRRAHVRKNLAAGYGLAFAGLALAFGIGVAETAALFSCVTTSLVKSMSVRANMTIGTPFRLTPEVSKTRSMFAAFTFVMTTAVISWTIPSRIRTACSCSCFSRVWRKSLISRSRFLMLAIFSSRSFAFCVFASALRAGASSC